MTREEQVKAIDNILKLPKDWDDEWADIISKEVWDIAKKIIKELYNETKWILVEPAIVPTINSWIDINYINDKYSIVIWIFNNQEVYYNILFSTYINYWWAYNKQEFLDYIYNLIK